MNRINVVVIQLSLGLCISNLILVFIIKRFVYLLLSIRNDIYFYAIIAWIGSKLKTRANIYNIYTNALELSHIEL